MIHNIPQPTFEQFLTEVISKEENVDLRKGISFVSLEQVGCKLVSWSRRSLTIRLMVE